MALNPKYLNLIRQGEDSSHYATCDCLKPHTQRIFDFALGTWRVAYVPCGRCIRCQDKRRNEMASRMFLHSLSTRWSYCYFVTLTYARIDFNKFECHPFKHDWLETIPHLDDFNKNGRLCMCPSILVRSHVIKFFKRLRKEIGSPISYAYCGEYGKKFGAPHFHAVVWCNRPIKYSQFVSAWSFECVKSDDPRKIYAYRGQDCAPRSRFRFRIGNVTVDDLWDNGSLDYDGKHPGSHPVKDANSKHAFTYVAKYLGKNNLNETGTLCKYAIMRHQYAFSTLPLDRKVMDLEAPNLGEIQSFYTETCDTIATYGSDRHAKISVGKPRFIKAKSYPTNYSYTKILTLNNLKYENLSYTAFRKVISPFFGSSRKYAIGKDYAIENLSRFEQKNYSLPKFRDKTITFPSYFVRLLSLKRNSLRIVKKVQTGYSLSKTSAAHLHRYFFRLREDRNYWFYVRDYLQTPPEVPPIGYGDFQLPNKYGTLAIGELDCFDLLTPDSTRIHYRYDPHAELFEGYVYDRSSVDPDTGIKGYYSLVDVCDRESFCDFLLDMIEKDYDFIEDNRAVQMDMFDLHQCIEENPLTGLVREQFINLRKQKQNEYDAFHTPID